MSSTPEPVVLAEGLGKDYPEGRGGVLRVLTEVDLRIDPGETLAVVGASGSGKSTLLNLLGGLDSPTRGHVRVCGSELHRLPERERGRLRNQHIGVVYQFHHLLPEFTALENVAMPLLLREESVEEASRRATETLEAVGLGERLTHKPGMLSGGERQRVAIARALVTRPSIIMADEPTGNLDERTARQVQELMLELNARYGCSLLVVTHDSGFAGRCGRRLELHDGTLRPIAPEEPAS